MHDARAFIAHRGEASPFVADMCWRGLRSFYRWCAAEDECANITERIKQPKMPVRPVKSVTEEEYKRLLIYCNVQAIPRGGKYQTAAWYGTRDAAIFAVLWSTRAPAHRTGQPHR